MKSAYMLCTVGWLATGLCLATEPNTGVRFEKLQLTDRYYCDGVDAGDMNNDGQLDVVAGPYWYQGPRFQQTHEFYPAVPLPTEDKPSNSMFSFVHDISGDGWQDILVLGRVKHHEAYWYENPGAADSEWKKHLVFDRVRGESPTFTDINGDGHPEILCHWEGQWGWLAPDWSAPRVPWQFQAVGPDEGWEEYYHGEGVGDVNGDGLQDIVLQDGWYEQPARSLSPSVEGKNWKFHRGRFSLERGGAQMFADDVNGDGLNDVISSLQAHEWGLAWFEQLPAGTDVNHADIRKIGERVFLQHKIMGDRTEEARYGVAFSQPHALDFADIDGDGMKDIVTGKRMWAHGPTGDVEPMAPPVVYWFQRKRLTDGMTTFIPHLIDDSSGLGTQVTARDVNGDHRIDILTASKLGTFVFLNRGN